MGSKNTYSIGIVDWFGGRNQKTGRENNFGFISSYLAEDFYVHKSDLINANLVEGQFVLFEEQQKNGKTSAKNVQILHPKVKAEQPAEAFLQLLSISTITTNLVANSSYKKHLVDWLNGPHGEIVFKQFKKSSSIKNCHLELIKLSKKANELFDVYTKNIDITALYESKINPELIPANYLIKNIKNIISWWQALDDFEVKSQLLEKGVSFLIRRKSFLTELPVTYSHNELEKLVKYLRDEFPIEPRTAQLINKVDSLDQLIGLYIKGSDIQTLLNNKIPISLLPESYVSNEIKSVISQIQTQKTARNQTQEIQLEAKLLKLILSKTCYIKSLLLDSSDDVALSFVSFLGKKQPLSEEILDCISNSKMSEQLFREYSKTYKLDDYIKAKVPGSALPKWYIEDQVTSFLAEFEKPHAYKAIGIPRESLKFILTSPAHRNKAINACVAVHPTNIFRLTRLLSSQDKAVENRLLDKVINTTISTSDIPSLLPLLLVQGSDFRNSFMSAHLDEVCSWLNSLVKSEKAEQLSKSIEQLDISSLLARTIKNSGHSPKALEFFDTSCLLALIFKGALTADDIGARINEIDSFVLTILRKQKANVAPYVRDVYKSCFATFNDFANHPVIQPLISANTILLKKEQIKWQIYSKDLSFVEVVEKTGEISLDPEYFVLAKLLPLINERNSYKDIESVILHEIWTALLNGALDINHPGLMNLFPACGSLPSGLSCEAFYWQTVERDPYTKKSEPQKVYLCRSSRCHNPQVEPELNKPYLTYNIYDWLSHYGVNYAVYSQPSKRDFAIKLAGYINRIKELHSRLNCRCCGTLMKPNMNYARVEATKFDPKQNKFITVAVQAAYRMTVFHCGNETCHEFNNNYYINHCLGFKCYELIDSRDIEDKCDEGRYICPECGSCCNKHREKFGHTNNGESDSTKHKNRYGTSPFIYKTTELG